MHDAYYSNNAVTVAYMEFFQVKSIDELDAILTEMYYGSKVA